MKDHRIVSRRLFHIKPKQFVCTPSDVGQYDPNGVAFKEKLINIGHLIRRADPDLPEVVYKIASSVF